MRAIVDYLVKDWKEKIESIHISGYSRTVDSISVFPMSAENSKEMYSYGEVWKVNFNLSNAPVSTDDVEDIPITLLRARYHDKIIEEFSNLLRTDSFSATQKRIDRYSSIIPDTNEYINYIEYQGTRLIIEFHPKSFLKDIRQSKIDSILDK
jgi:hypothetical protein